MNNPRKLEANQSAPNSSLSSSPKEINGSGRGDVLHLFREAHAAYLTREVKVYEDYRSSMDNAYRRAAKTVCELRSAYQRQRFEDWEKYERSLAGLSGDEWREREMSERKQLVDAARSAYERADQAEREEAKAFRETLDDMARRVQTGLASAKSEYVAALQKAWAEIDPEQLHARDLASIGASTSALAHRAWSRAS